MRTRSDRHVTARLSRGFVIVAVLLFASTSSYAQSARPIADDASSSAARALFDDGSRLYDLGAYDEAIGRFERAYTMTGAPTLLLNIAQAHRLNGACAQAAMFYRRFLEKDPGTRHRAEIQARVDAMDTCAAATPAQGAPVAVPTAPRGAEPTPTPATPATPPTQGAADADAHADADADTHARWRTAGWCALGVATVSAAVSVTSLGVALGRDAELHRSCNAEGGCPRSEQSRVESYETWRSVSIVGGVVTGLAVGVAIFGFVRGREPVSRSSQARVVEPWIANGQLGIRGVF